MSKNIQWKKIGRDVGASALALGGGYALTRVLSGSSSSSSSSSSDSDKGNTGNPNSSDTTDSNDSNSSSSSSNKSSSSSKGSSYVRSNPSQYRVQNAKLEKPSMIYVAPENMSIQRVGLEVYDTDDESFQPYLSSLNGKASENVRDIDVQDEAIDSESSDDESSSSNDYETTTFKLRRGDIKDTYYYNDLTSINFESDYKEMTNSATLTKQDINLSQFYKGVRTKIISEWEEPLTTLEWDELQECIEGWITEQTFKDEEIEIKLSGLCILLDQNLQFKFAQLPRSRILYEILLTAGLTPWINVEGLDDDILDFNNEINTNNNNNSSNTPIGESSGNIAELAQQVCQGKNSDKKKAMAIHTYIHNHVDYPTPNYSNHKKCPTQVLKSGLSNCCDRARLGHEMANAVGLKNRGVHGTKHVWIQYYINGEWVNSDPGDSRPNLGSVWNNLTVDSIWKFPSCN